MCYVRREMAESGLVRNVVHLGIYGRIFGLDEMYYRMVPNIVRQF